LLVASAAVAVQLSGQVAIEQGDKHLPEVGASSHPLHIVAAAVKVRPVELPPREGRLDPREESFVTHVHPEGDLRVSAIPAKVAFAD
jgi:hypothetical protein